MQTPQDFQPDRHAVAVARARQAMTMIQLVPKIDKLMEEAAAARIAAPGLCELRQWAVFVIEAAAEAAAEWRAAA